MPDTSPAVTDPAAYRHWVDHEIRFSDQDPGGHVNNIAYAAYVEHGRVTAMRGLDFPRQPGQRFIVAHLAIDYRAEAQFPGKLRIGTRLERIGTKSLTLAHGIFMDGRCLATARSVIVHMIGPDTTPIPDAVRAAAATLG